jgi:transposase
MSNPNQAAAEGRFGPFPPPPSPIGPVPPRVACGRPGRQPHGEVAAWGGRSAPWSLGAAPDQIAQVPGRKTDVNDAAWIAQLLECGLIRASFVPPPPIRELRDLTRNRKLLIQERTRHANRLHKVLEDTGIKLTSVATRLLGASGRAMLDALVAGTTTPEVLADLARGKLRKKLPALRQALVGHFRAHHAFLVSQLLAHLDYLDEAIETISTQIDGVMAPFAEELARLDTIRGVNERTAEVLIAELGVDMTVFPTAKHAASWAGLCPGNHERAGKHHSGRTRHGNRWLRTALIEAALAASLRSTTGAFAARYRRVRHRGHKKAIVAVAHAILVTAYHLLARQIPYEDPVPTTTTAGMPSGSATGPSKRWNAKAIASPSNPQPEREGWPTSDFLSNASSRSGPMGGDRKPCQRFARARRLDEAGGGLASVIAASCALKPCSAT